MKASHAESSWAIHTETGFPFDLTYFWKSEIILKVDFGGDSRSSKCAWIPARSSPAPNMIKLEFII